MLKEETLCDDSKDEVYENYKYIIDICKSKYANALSRCAVDYQEVNAECLFAFNEAILSYNVSKNTSFATYASLCIQRKLSKIVRNASTNKNKLLNQAYSLDYVYSETGLPLAETLEDDKNDPILILETEEKTKVIENKIKENLSDFEYKVYNLMLDNIDCYKIANILKKDNKKIENAITRVKIKVKEIIDKEKTGVN